MAAHEENNDIEIKQILTNTKVVTVLGTPHRGSKKANYALFVAKALSPLHHFNQKILATLRTTSIVGWDWKNRYISAIRHRNRNASDPIMLFYFFESQGMALIGKVRKPI